MNIKTSITLTLLLSAIILSACGSANVPEPTSTPLPTNTPEPQPTATEVREESGYFQYTNEQWLPLYEDELDMPFFLPEEMGGDMGQDNQMIQYGYFAEFNTEENILTLYARLLMADVYRKLNFQLVDDQTAYCLPEKAGDTAIENLTFFYSGDQVNFPPGNGTVNFSEAVPTLTERTYFVIVLAEPVHADGSNSVSQLAMVCP